MIVELKDAEVLVTGATGFIGSHLTRRLVKRGAKVNIFVRKDSSLWRIKDVKEDVEIFQVDITNQDAIIKAIRQIEPLKIYHLAAFVDVSRSLDVVENMVEINIKGTLNLLNALDDAEFDCFVNTGSVEEYGTNDTPFIESQREEPISPYSASKVATTHFCQMLYKTHQMPIVTLRPFLAYGPYQNSDMLIPSIIKKCLTKEDFKMTKGEQTRQFNYVYDVVEGFIKASISKKAIGEVINIGGGKEYSVREFATKINEMLGEPIKLLFGALPYRNTEIWRMACDCSKAKKILNWEPQYSPEEGLQQTITWYKNYLKGSN